MGDPTDAIVSRQELALWASIDRQGSMPSRAVVLTITIAVAQDGFNRHMPTIYMPNGKIQPPHGNSH